MKIFLAGANGFVGTRVLRDLHNAGHRITALAHGSNSRFEIQRMYPDVTIVLGDVSKPHEMQRIVPNGIEAIVYLPGLLREFPNKGITFQGVHVEGVRNLIAEAKRVGATRWIQMSALGAESESTGKYYQTKWAAEQLVRDSGLEWTIIRPSVIFDDQPTTRMNFVSELADVVKKVPVLPIFGDGLYRMQPVSVDDVSQTVLQSLTNPETAFHSYDLGGPEKLTYIQLMQQIAQALGKRKGLLHIPFGLVEIPTALFQSFEFYPITLDQLHMLEEENIVHDPKREEEWQATFELPMKRFGESIGKQLGE